ncbi:hypothetical protein B0A48_02891 [Cryoendolithus antarcticus]|uniref:Fatty acid hydroxylase domain-containing protein n=1 Tax=Cryoendolithus antarcticus TaxID=1507870 RepID=A0A1V8TLK3_9PEZI|nr:hypothetical protein B0A48_02891 [Cryoendolithus antarcticus]
MASIVQSLRDNALYFNGYMQGRSYGFPTSLSQLYGTLMSRVTSFISLPLPLLSFLALPVFGGTSTSINLLLFWATWSSLILTHDPLNVEAYGTLAVRLLFFLLPALASLGFDAALPGASKGIKAYGGKHMPSSLGRERMLKIAGIATLNVLLAIALQAALEVLTTDFLHARSILKVTSMVPLPWNIAKDVLKGLAVRGVVHYLVHRYLLHNYDSPLKTWHLQWQHSVRLPFSIVAAYDHPVCYLLAVWVPAFLPAYLFRFHVLTWHIFVALISLEDLFINSGYAVLPSSIILAGMARRTDAHFVTAKRGDVCNFGHTGLLDLVFGTACKDTTTLAGDLEEENEVHHLGERARKGARGAIRGLKDRGDNKSAQETADADADGEDPEDQEYLPADASEARGNQASGSDTRSPVKRRSGRTKTQQAN